MIFLKNHYIPCTETYIFKKFLLTSNSNLTFYLVFLCAKSGDFNPREHERGYLDSINLREALFLYWFNLIIKEHLCSYHSMISIALSKSFKFPLWCTLCLENIVNFAIQSRTL